MVNEGRVQWARRSFDFPSRLKEPDLEISNLILTGKSSSDPDYYRESRFQATDNFSLTHGNHALKFGADFNNLRDTTQWDLFFPARVIFPTLPAFFAHAPVVFWWPTLNPALNNGVTQRSPLPVPFTESVPAAEQPFTRVGIDHSAYGFFAQDEWRATPKLTLTLGLRYDFEPYPEHLVPQADLNNFQPRVGFAYSFNSRTVARVGFGIFHSRLASSGVGQSFVSVQWSGPFVPGNPLNPQNIAALYPAPLVPLVGRFINPTVRGPLAPPATLTFTTTGQVPNLTAPGVASPGLTFGLTQNLRTPYSEQASAEISHEVGGGVRGFRAVLVRARPQARSSTGMLNGVRTGTQPSGEPIFGARRFTDLGDFFVQDSGGYSIYKRRQSRDRKALRPGFQLQTALYPTPRPSPIRSR
jgi:hypothetical protein